MKASLGTCPRLCFAASPLFCVPFKYILIKKPGKSPRSQPCMSNVCHMFNTLIEILEFQNDLNRLEYSANTTDKCLTRIKVYFHT